MKPIRISTPAQARLYLRITSANPRPEYIQALIDYFMRVNTECPIAEYLSIALTYVRYGKIKEAREMIKDVAEFVCSDGRKKKGEGKKT